MGGDVHNSQYSILGHACDVSCWPSPRTRLARRCETAGGGDQGADRCFTGKPLRGDRAGPPRTPRHAPFEGSEEQSQLIPVRVGASTLRGIPKEPKFQFDRVRHRLAEQRQRMGAALTVTRTDHSAAELRSIAGRCRDAAQVGQRSSWRLRRFWIAGPVARRRRNGRLVIASRR